MNDANPDLLKQCHQCIHLQWSGSGGKERGKTSMKERRRVIGVCLSLHLLLQLFPVCHYPARFFLHLQEDIQGGMIAQWVDKEQRIIIIIIRQFF